MLLVGKIHEALTIHRYFRMFMCISASFYMSQTCFSILKLEESPC